MHVTAQTGGFILAGGESSRMGQSKALLQLNGAPMILHVANLVASITGSAIVIGPPHAYDPFGLHTIADDFPGAGPLGGIATALRAADKPWNLIVACDMPYLTQPWLHHLIARALASPAADALIPMSEGGAEPLCAMYHKRCEAPVRAALARGTRKVTDGLSAVRVQTIAPADWKAFDSNGLLFKNMNSPEDYEEAKARLEKGARGRATE